MSNVEVAVEAGHEGEEGQLNKETFDFPRQVAITLEKKGKQQIGIFFLSNILDAPQKAL